MKDTTTKKDNKPKEGTNRHFAQNDTKFIDLCNKAGIKPTKRQASKYRMQKGLAYKELKKLA